MWAMKRIQCYLDGNLVRRDLESSRKEVGRVRGRWVESKEVGGVKDGGGVREGGRGREKVGGVRGGGWGQKMVGGVRGGRDPEKLKSQELVPSVGGVQCHP